MNELPIDAIRVVIVGQDPSPNPDVESSGFSFHDSICPSTKKIIDFSNEEFKLVDTFCKGDKPLALNKEKLDEEKRKCSLTGWIQQGAYMDLNPASMYYVISNHFIVIDRRIDDKFQADL